MQATTDNQGSVLVAPQRLIASTRAEFRETALNHIDRIDASAGVLVIDMRSTVELDASGLGILVLVQKKAKDRGLSTRLHQTPERVRNLLKLTLLDFLFELSD